MNRRTRVRFALSAALSATLLCCLPAALADPATPLRVHLRIVDACALDGADAVAGCAVAHQRSDDDTPAAPQVQALTPAPDGDDDDARPWLTLTF
ncbi:hypothetical protein [Stenotrophomonas sp. PD6]|uniref:hypothetical protein n=1 Tax=Stenotrophomonas sp. PD6 TaxID=3368612 RepID=UPI003BA1E883